LRKAETGNVTPAKAGGYGEKAGFGAFAGMTNAVSATGTN